MLRQVVKRASRLNIRKFHSSSLLKTERLEYLAALENNDISHLNEIIKEASISDWEKEVPNEIIGKVSSNVKFDSFLKPEEKVQFHNSVLENLLAKDKTLVSYHTKEIYGLRGKLTPEALKEIISHNSGRVSSSWELFEKHIEDLTVPYSSDVESFNVIVKLTIDKLLNGEIIDKDSEQPYQPSRNNILKAVFLKSLLGKDGEEFLKSLLDHSLTFNDYKAIEALGSHDRLLEELKDNADYLKLVSVIGLKSVDRAHIHELVLKATDSDVSIEDIEEINNVGEETVKMFRELNSKFKTLQIPVNDKIVKIDKDAMFEEILELSEKLINDKSSFDPKLRASLLKVYGINKNELTESLELYDDFSLSDGKNVDIYMTAMVQVLSYHAVQSSNKTFLSIAESLLPDPIPISALQSLILANSAFDLNKSLELYNDYISSVSKEHKSTVSQATRLTESLLIAFLSKRDREFANLIHDGAVTNEVVTGDAAIEILKNCFKRYGVIVGEEEDKIERLLKQTVLEAIKKLPVT